MNSIKSYFKFINPSFLLNSTFFLRSCYVIDLGLETYLVRSFTFCFRFNTAVVKIAWLAYFSLRTYRQCTKPKFCFSSQKFYSILIPPHKKKCPEALSKPICENLSFNAILFQSNRRIKSMHFQIKTILSIILPFVNSTNLDVCISNFYNQEEMTKKEKFQYRVYAKISDRKLRSKEPENFNFKSLSRSPIPINPRWNFPA